jgi:hypothetical protein
MAGPRLLAGRRKLAGVGEAEGHPRRSRFWVLHARPGPLGELVPRFRNNPAELTWASYLQAGRGAYRPRPDAQAVQDQELDLPPLPTTASSRPGISDNDISDVIATNDARYVTA